jgi:hypothetical protein
VSTAPIRALAARSGGLSADTEAREQDGEHHIDHHQAVWHGADEFREQLGLALCIAASHAFFVWYYMYEVGREVP